MAKTYKNKKGFLIIQMNNAEAVKIWGKHGGHGICDRCNRTKKDGYFIACLNEFFCKECFNEWQKTAIRYIEDLYYEEIQYKDVRAKLIRAKLWEE